MLNLFDKKIKSHDPSEIIHIC